MNCLKQILIVFASFVLTAAACEPEKTGYNLPVPKPVVTPEIPGQPDPEDPVDPVDPPAPPVDSARLARIGQIPVIEVYFTEYTKPELFPTLEDIRCFTHVNVGHGRFANKQTGDGGIVIEDKGYLKRIVAYKQDYPELKVKLMIGGWGKNADGFSQMARDPEKRRLFVSECVRICNEYGVDGFDIDWEYPTYAARDGDYINGASYEDYANFVTLFKEMREAMPDKILSYAASDSGKYTDNAGVLEYADYINVMTYSMGNPPYHNSPLHRSPITKARSCDEVIDDIFHGQQGIPYDRMNFGVAFYGHGDSKVNSNNPVYPGTINYGMLPEILFQGTCDGKSVKGKNYRIWDDVAKVPYLGDALGTMYASYEDIESLNYKVEYLKSRGMLGAMAWEYREDDAAGTLRYALKHAMDGNPDQPGRIERPDAAKIPVMGSYKKYILANVTELSGLCISADGTHLWGVGDQGSIYNISYDGTATEHWYHDADMEGITLNPATGDMYIAIEGSQKIYLVSAPDYNTYKTIWYVQEAIDGEYGNSGIEGITWYKDGKLFVGSQTHANLWTYTADGTKLALHSLKKVASDITEVADLCYDPETDMLWVVDSNVFKIYLFNGDGTSLLASYDISSLTQDNPESICVDHMNKCVWVADDDEPSRLFRIEFSDL